MASILAPNMHFAKTGAYSVVEPGQPRAAPAQAPSGGGSAALSAACTRQASTVKQMKKNGKPAEAIQTAVDQLKKLRAELAIAEKADSGQGTSHEIDRKLFDETVLRRMFVVPAFEIHGGVTGLFDLGPPGCALKANIVEAWRRHFVLEEKMLEMECTCLTPEPVLKTSGHVDRFTDLMVKDVQTGDCYRADKLLEDHIDDLLEKSNFPAAEADAHLIVQRQADAYSPEELGAILAKYGIKSPDTGNDLTKPFAFNLMFGTKIGPSGALTGFLRPETAQGLFVNFRRLLDYNNGRVPFAAAQIGLGFRNEIAPKNGLLRVREFTMAEIEHFVKPDEKRHPKFANVADVTMKLFDRDAQLGTGIVASMTCGDAVSKNTIANETLAYFMARTQLFMLRIGMSRDKLRFRQHLSTEMAHYAADCWDLEILTAYGWVECVGHADRACYDLKVHSEATGTSVEAQKMLDTPVEVLHLTVKPERKTIGLTFKKDQKAVCSALEGLDSDTAALVEKAHAAGTAYDVNGYSVQPGMVSFTRKKKMVQVVKFTPSVIEPSFGIGRILHALLEHSFSVRKDDAQRVVFQFAPVVAPIKCGVYNLQSGAKFPPIVTRVVDMLTRAGISTKSDTSGQSVGKRYARADELGVPFGVTIDFATVEDNTVTLRERDSMTQRRVPISALPGLLRVLCGLDGDVQSWAVALAAYPAAGAAVDGPIALETTSRGVFSRPAELVKK